MLEAPRLSANDLMKCYPILILFQIVLFISQLMPWFWLQVWWQSGTPLKGQKQDPSSPASALCKAGLVKHSIVTQVPNCVGACPKELSPHSAHMI